MRLTATNHSLECLTSSASAIGWHAVYNRLTASDSTALDGQGSIAAASTATIVAAPAVAEQIDVLSLNARNNGGLANEITIQKNVGGTLTILFDASLNPGDMLQYSPTQGFSVLDPQGRQKRVTEDAPPLSGRVSSFVRSTATPAEAAGVRYWPAKDAGAPAPYAIGTPGLSGRAVDGLSAADAGCFPLWAPTGSLWLRRLFLNCSVACSVEFIDLLLVNSGIVVNTTTAQTLNTVTLPARDAMGTTSGTGVMAALLVTTATTNAAAITNCTISYTNSAGVAGRTGTMTSFPATAVVGSMIPFELQSGDTGIRSVQSIALGTSFVAGAVSLLLYRIVDMAAQAAANAGVSLPGTGLLSIRLWPNSAIFPVVYPTGTGSTTVTAAIYVEER